MGSLLTDSEQREPELSGIVRFDASQGDLGRQGYANVTRATVTPVLFPLDKANAKKETAPGREADGLDPWTGPLAQLVEQRTFNP